MTKSEQSTGLGVVGVAGWRTDAPPMDGTVIYRRVMQPYRYLPYKPNSQQAKRGEAGRWQMMNEYGGWDNCAHPLGNEWSLENPFLSPAPSMPPTTHPATGEDV